MAGPVSDMQSGALYGFVSARSAFAFAFFAFLAG